MPGVITFNDTPVKITHGIHDHTDSAGQAGYVIKSDGTTWSWQDSHVDVDTVNSNTHIGHNVGTGSTGINNTIIGHDSGFNGLTSDNNMFLGYSVATQPLANNGNVAIGSYSYSDGTGGANTAIGSFSLRYVEGSANIGIGQGALNEPGNTADNNVAVGSYSLKYVTTGANNTAVGNLAGNGNTNSITGSNNFLGGYYSGYNISGGSYNVSIGSYSLYSITTGSGNVAIGHAAMYYRTNFNNSVAIGVDSMKFNSDLSIAIGHKAAESSQGYNNTTVGPYSFRYGTGNNNVSIGLDVLNGASNSGKFNIGVGTYVMRSNTSGEHNIAIGTNALDSNTLGVYNVCIGTYSGRYNVIGSYNTFIGYESGLNNTANNNTFIGKFSGKQNRIGEGNTGVGHHSLLNMSTGNAPLTETQWGKNNTALGFGAGQDIYSGRESVLIGANCNPKNPYQCVFIGYVAGGPGQDYTETGNPNDISPPFGDIGIGTGALESLTNGTSNIAIGSGSGSLITTGYDNICIGATAGGSLTTVGENVFIGSLAGNQTSSDGNVFVGHTSGRYNTSGTYNVFIGYKSGHENTIGGYNTNIGYEAGYDNKEGIYNTSIGFGANRVNTSDKNTSVGFLALYENTSGSQNTAVGTEALRGSGNGYNVNTAKINNCVGIGTNAGQRTHTNSDCIYIGCNAQPNANNTKNEIVIGANVTGGGSNTITLGNSSITQAFIGPSITIGEQDWGSDYVGISATPWVNQTDYMIMQQISTGDVYLNAPENISVHIRNGNNDKIVINSGVDFRTTTSNSALSSTTSITLQHYLGRRDDTGAYYYHVNAGTSGSQYSWGGYPGFLSWQGSGEVRIQGNGTFICPIRVDGGYLTFTGSHDTFTPFRKEDIGKIVYSMGNYETEFKDGVKYNKISIMDSCPIVSLTTTENDKRVIGVLSQLRTQEFTDEITDVEYSNLEDKSEYIQSAIDPTVYIKTTTTDIFNRGAYNAVGEGGIWVSNKNGNLENGDYITSSTIPGYGQRQNDDILRNYTVAKITCDCDFTEIVVVTKNHKITGKHYEYDENGNPVYENVLDEQGNETTHLKHELRYLLADGTQITKEEYSERNDAYIAAFVGCTYHCG